VDYLLVNIEHQSSYITADSDPIRPGCDLAHG
jgi:hypothetical protein